MLQHLTALAESTGDDLLSLIGQSFDITAQLESLSLPRILLALLTATLCGAIIYLVYRMFYRGVVYSDNFNILVLLITVVTAFIIMTISANLVLSLGMVGALSIVRFRSAIKDPLDVGFLFWGSRRRYHGRRRTLLCCNHRYCFCCGTVHNSYYGEEGAPLLSSCCTLRYGR